MLHLFLVIVLLRSIHSQSLDFLKSTQRCCCANPLLFHLCCFGHCYWCALNQVSAGYKSPTACFRVHHQILLPYGIVVTVFCSNQHKKADWTARLCLYSMCLRDTNLAVKGDEKLFVINMYFSLLVHYKLLVNWERVMFFKICGNKICDFSFCDSVCLNFIIFYE